MSRQTTLDTDTVINDGDGLPNSARRLAIFSIAIETAASKLSSLHPNGSFQDSCSVNRPTMQLLLGLLMSIRAQQPKMQTGSQDDCNFAVAPKKHRKRSINLWSPPFFAILISG